MTSYGPIPKDAYREVVKNSTLSSLDLLINDRQRLLVGLRKNAPAKGFYYVPGAVIYHGEPVHEAFKRITQQELGTMFTLEDAQFVGIMEEHFDDNFSGDPTFGTHYRAECYAVTVDFSKLAVTLDDQHSDHIAMTYEDIMTRPDVHPYNRWHVERLRLFASKTTFSQSDINKLAH